MAEFRRGDVVLVRFPFTDFRATKLRPAVVLAVHGEDVIVAGIFSTPPTGLKDTWLLIKEGEPAFAQTGLKKTSVAKGEKLAILHRSVIRTTIGTLPPPLLHTLAQRIKAALELS